MNNILTFGELLYDVYDNVSVIGGAPFNYSLQLSRLINNEDKLRFITALGNDDYSKDAINFINNENIDSSLIEILDNYETGKATVFLNEKKVPDYIIHENVAWDNIEYNENIEKALQEKYDMFYFNILSQRNEKSYSTLKKIFKNIDSKYKVCDVTFRKNYYTKDKIKESLEFVNILKINDDELAVIKELFYPSLENDNDFWYTWKNETDKKLMNPKSEEEKKAYAQRIEEIRDKYSDEIEFYKFCQFVLEKQNEETKKYALSKGIKMIADRQVAFSDRDAWAYQSLFLEGWYLGCPPDYFSKDGQAWGFPVMDPDKMFNPDGSLGEGGVLMKNLYKKMFKENPGGVRIDHIVGLIDPWVYKIGKKPKCEEGAGRLYSSPEHPELSR